MAGYKGNAYSGDCGGYLLLDQSDSDANGDATPEVRGIDVSADSTNPITIGIRITRLATVAAHARNAASTVTECLTVLGKPEGFRGSAWKVVAVG